ncbi:hypothetical protein [Nonomuraea rubra]|uniref:hypothetical protein n=1 Tax=Nonomuraea rubra TaxID=46180 RepID=UPI0031EC5DF7
MYDEAARAGYSRAATLDTGIRLRAHRRHQVAVHRYTFPAHNSARVVIDLSCAAWPSTSAGPVPVRRPGRTSMAPRPRPGHGG